MGLKPITSSQQSEDFARIVELSKTDEGITRLDEINSFGLDDSLFDDSHYDQELDLTVRGVH